MTAYCKVGYCRYNRTHVTKGHKCGRCGEYGHGDFECGDNRRVYMLEKFFSDELPNSIQCTVSDCEYQHLHTVDAHHCPRCRRRETHTVAECTMNTMSSIGSNTRYNIKCPICRTDNTLCNPKKILGLNDKCCICMDNNVEILFPTCNHVCVCKACVDKLNI
jgi:hypothetical protein